MNGSFATLARVLTSEECGSAHVTMLGLKIDDETAGRNYGNRAPGEPDDLVYIMFLKAITYFLQSKLFRALDNVMGHIFFRSSCFSKL